MGATKFSAIALGLFVGLVGACAGSDAVLPPEEPIPPDPPLGRYTDEVVEWAVPELDNGGFHAANIASGGNHWSAFDIDGDGRPDLVQTRDPEAGSNVVFDSGSTPHWRVFLNDGTGFASTDLIWPVPESAGFSIHKPQETERWTLIDLDGDDLVDLVRTTDPNTNAVWDHGADPHWVVHLNTGEGFSMDETNWPLAADPGTRGIFWIEGATTGEGAWALRDLDNDGALDLVRTADPGSPLKVLGFGTEEHTWEWNRNDGTGFEDVQTWSVPIVAEASGGIERPAFAERWDTFDITMDGIPDLVQTSNLSGAVMFDGGAPVWHVFPGGETGFANEATNWAVPNAAHMGGFIDANANTGVRIWRTTDIDADGDMDLVSTSNTGAAMPTVWGAPSRPQWKVYRGESDGFSRDVTTWTVPETGRVAGFYSPSSEEWQVIDLDGDGVMELIHARDNDATGTQVYGFGEPNPHWRVYKAVPGLLTLGE